VKAKEPVQTTLRIVTQYRVGSGFVYELEHEGAKLDVHMRRAGEEGAAETWCVEARNGHGSDSLMFAGSGSTRSEALEHAGIAWEENASKFVLARFEWAQVAKLLANVGAI
jgi:hypothetical protein